MTEQKETEPKRVSFGWDKINWPLLRKFETLIFTAMLMALPWFAFKVIDVATNSLMVKTIVAELAKDLLRAKEMSRSQHRSITVTSRAASAFQAGAYTIKDGERILEEVELPRGVNVIGEVTFSDTGIPQAAATFIVTKGPKTQHVDVDTLGMVSAP